MSESSFGNLSGWEAVSEYISRFRRANVPPLRIARPLDLFPDQPIPSGITPGFTWNNSWPFENCAGVYMIYSAAFELLYIGKTSMNQCLGRRLYAHFGGSSVCMPTAEWSITPRFIINIAVPEDMPFEAPAIEEFLIKKLRPKLNGVGK